MRSLRTSAPSLIGWPAGLVQPAVDDRARRWRAGVTLPTVRVWPAVLAETVGVGLGLRRGDGLHEARALVLGRLVPVGARAPRGPIDGMSKLVLRTAGIAAWRSALESVVFTMSMTCCACPERAAQDRRQRPAEQPAAGRRGHRHGGGKAEHDTTRGEQRHRALLWEDWGKRVSSPDAGSAHRRRARCASGPAPGCRGRSSSLRVSVFSRFWRIWSARFCV